MYTLMSVSILMLYDMPLMLLMLVWMTKTGHLHVGKIDFIFILTLNQRKKGSLITIFVCMVCYLGNTY